MKKWIKMMLCGAVALTTFSLSGCVLLEPLFDGVVDTEIPVEETDEATKYFAGEYKASKWGDVLSFVNLNENEEDESGAVFAILENNKKTAMNATMEGAMGELSMKITFSAQTEKGEEGTGKYFWRATSTGAQEEGEVALEESEYFDGEYCYYAYTEDGETLKEKAPGDFNAVALEILNCGEVMTLGDAFANLNEFTQTEIYVDNSVAGQTKIKVILRLDGIEDENVKAEAEIYWIYQGDKLIAYKTTSSELVEEEGVKISMSGSMYIMPWEGSIEAPADLDSYEDAEAGENT